jgi:putative membrane protein
MFILSALLAVITDFNLEPVASQVKHYWTWFDDGFGYEGIPGLNFFGWWMTSFVILIGVYSRLPEDFQIRRTPWIPYVLLAAINLLFALINLRAGFYLPVFTALICIL